jgi:hypothetical protein
MVHTRYAVADVQLDAAFCGIATSRSRPRAGDANASKRVPDRASTCIVCPASAGESSGSGKLPNSAAFPSCIGEAARGGTIRSAFRWRDARIL